MKRIRIKNWEIYQHYKKGRGTPPWVKLHTKIINSSDWIKATDLQRLHMLCCLIVGAMNDGWIPSDQGLTSVWEVSDPALTTVWRTSAGALVQSVCRLKWRVEILPLIRLGFLEEVLADASTMLANASTKDPIYEETERESQSQSVLASASTGAPQPSAGAPSEGSGNKQERGAPPPGFAEFWISYPKKASKPAAIKAFARAMKKVDLATLMAALEAQKPRWNPEFTKNPATWLNNECWNDETAKVVIGFPI